MEQTCCVLNVANYKLILSKAKQMFYAEETWCSKKILGSQAIVLLILTKPNQEAVKNNIWTKDDDGEPKYRF